MQEVDVIAGKVIDVSATLVATRIQPSSTLQEGKLWEDIRIGIIVNKVEKAVVLPPEITEELGLFLKEMPKPAKGNDLVCIQLTIVKIKNLHVISMGRVYRANVRHQASSKSGCLERSVQGKWLKFLREELSPYW